MRRKHPKRKEDITPLSNDDLSAPRKSIDFDVFQRTLRLLQHDTAPGLGCLRNEHLLL